MVISELEKILVDAAYSGSLADEAQYRANIAISYLRNHNVPTSEAKEAIDLLVKQFIEQSDLYSKLIPPNASVYDDVAYSRVDAALLALDSAKIVRFYCYS